MEHRWHHDSDKPYDFDLRPRQDPDEDAFATLKFRKLDSTIVHPRSALKESYYYFNKESPHEVIPMHMHDEQYEDSLNVANQQEADMIHHVRDFPESDKGKIIDRFADMGTTDYGFSHLKDTEKWRSEH